MNKHCQAVTPDIGNAAAIVESISGDNGAGLTDHHGDIFRKRTVTRPISDAEDPLTYHEFGCVVVLFDDRSGDFATRDGGRPIAAGAVRPRCRPLEFTGRNPGGVDSNNDVVFSRMR